MIPKDTVDKIIETARVEEVVGDFITLKKRGANLLGLCPFHGEKSPSFTVSPSKGIYKCFGCGKAGNSVNFIMEHESLSYPDALRYLAAKYNIEATKMNLDKDVAQAKSDLLATTTKLKNYEIQVEQAKEALNLANIRYKAGVITNLEMLTAQTDLQNAELGQIQLQFQVLLSTLTINQIGGTKFW